MTKKSIKDVVDVMSVTLFGGMIVSGFITLAENNFYPWTRMNLFVETPHAYKVILWALVALLVLRQKYGGVFIVSFVFWYSLNETIGNTIYAVYHWWEWPMSQLTFLGNWVYWIMFPLFAIWAWWMLRTMGKRPYIWYVAFMPFVAIQLYWLIHSGFHTEYDQCCGKNYTGNWKIEGLDALWSAAFMWGVALSERKDKKRHTLVTV